MVLYSLDDLNRIAGGLDAELGGTWEVLENDQDDREWATLTGPDGEANYSFNTGWWWVETASNNAERLERLVSGFLVGIGVDRSETEATASRIVTARTESGRSCTGPHELSVFVYKADNGSWVVVFIPVLGNNYSKHPKC